MRATAGAVPPLGSGGWPSTSVVGSTNHRPPSAVRPAGVDRNRFDCFPPSLLITLSGPELGFPLEHQCLGLSNLAENSPQRKTLHRFEVGEGGGWGLIPARLKYTF